MKITNCEKALDILRLTRDGGALSPADLSLVELAVNNLVSKSGQQAFERLHEQVNAGLYSAPWFHGIEHLTYGHDGYVRWKGRCVDHFSFSDPDEEAREAVALAERCQALEEKGFPINMATSDTCTPYYDAPAGTPWAEIIRHVYTAFARAGRVRWVILSFESDAIAVSKMGDEIVLRYGKSEAPAGGCHALFHTLQREGMECVGSRLQSYAGFIGAMEEAELKPSELSRVLLAEHPALIQVTNVQCLAAVA